MTVSNLAMMLLGLLIVAPMFALSLVGAVRGDNRKWLTGMAAASFGCVLVALAISN